MCCLNDQLSNFERHSALAAHASAEAAEKARDRKRAARSNGQMDGPAEHRRVVEAQYDAEIAHHEKMSRVHRRRQEHAAAGFLLHSQDESRDAEYMRTHGALFNEARRAGRVRYGEEIA
jgi:hypothetical protein